MDTLERAGLDPFIEIDAKQVKRNTQVISKVKMILDVNHAMVIGGVLLLQMAKDLDLDNALLFEALLVPNDFDGNVMAFLVVIALDDLPKGALSKEREDLVAVANVVMLGQEIVAASVVKACQELGCR